MKGMLNKMPALISVSLWLSFVRRSNYHTKNIAWVSDLMI